MSEPAGGHEHHGYDVDPTHHHPPQPDLEDIPLARHQVMQMAVTSLLIEKGIFSGDDMRAQVERMDGLGPARGAQLVARAWVDDGFRRRLLADSKLAAAELGMDIGPIPILVMENTPDTHNLVVCTLCSCYPKFLLGVPPDWYKSRNYRRRAVREPRKVLAEFGTELDPDVAIQGARQYRRHAVHDPSDPTGRLRRHDRGGTGRAGHPGQPHRRDGAARRLTAPFPCRRSEAGEG